MTSHKLDIQPSVLPGRIFLSPPHMGGEEMRYIQKAFESNYIAPLGPQVDAFEREFSEYTGIPHCVALTSGTAAMHLALRYMIQQRSEAKGQRSEVGSRRSGVKDQRSEGDTFNSSHEVQSFRPLVLASTLTFIGSVTPAMFEGCDLTFIDCDRKTWNMDPSLLKEELAACSNQGRLPVAVVPTDLYGQCCDLGRILEISDRYGVPVICDSAEAMGARYCTESRGQRSEVGGQKSKDSSQLTAAWRHAGHGAAAAVFSFNGNKIITTSGGGMLASNDKELIEKARFWSQQARDPFPHYEHSEIGYNYRMSNIIAAIGLGQLRVLEDRVRRKLEIFDYYKEALSGMPGIEFMPEAVYGRSNRWLTVILINPEKFGANREAVRLALEAENIEARPVWKPMHLQPVFQPEIRGQRSEVSKYTTESFHSAFSTHHSSLSFSVVGGKVSEELFEKGLCLPSGTAMGEEDLKRVVNVIKKI